MGSNPTLSASLMMYSTTCRCLMHELREPIALAAVGLAQWPVGYGKVGVHDDDEAVLSGEVAVPCHLQSAIAGLNSS